MQAGIHKEHFHQCLHATILCYPSYSWHFNLILDLNKFCRRHKNPCDDRRLQNQSVHVHR